MNYRNYKFLAQTGEKTSGTLVHDINMQDPISSIVFELRVHNTVDTPTNHPAACLTKIELVDGSDVLYSLNGLQAHALDWYNNNGRFRNNWNAYMPGDTMEINLGLNFGRFLWDPEWGFDPKRFNNPQLRITYNCALGGNTSDYIKLTGYANLFDEKVPSLKGFLMSKEIKQYTVEAGHEYTDMPLDYPYRAIYFQPRHLGTDPYTDVSNFKLSEDQDKRIPIDMSLYDIVSNLLVNYPLVHEYILIQAVFGGHDAICTPGFSANGVVSQYRGGVPLDAQCSVVTFNGGRFTIRAKAMTTNAAVHVIGCCPHTVLEIPCGLKDDPADWYDVRRLGSLRSDITGLAGDAIAHLFLQQARLY